MKKFIYLFVLFLCFFLGFSISQFKRGTATYFRYDGVDSCESVGINYEVRFLNPKTYEVYAINFFNDVQFGNKVRIFYDVAKGNLQYVDGYKDNFGCVARLHFYKKEIKK
jgi:hypothetical protein